MPRVPLFAADLLISQQLKDEQITEKELTDYTVGVRFAAGNNLALQLISPKRARTALDQQIWWSDPSKITKIKASLYERANIGEFGYYQPGTHELKIGGIADPNEMLLYFGALAQNKSKPAATEEALETIYALSRPEQTEETILHEGLHAAWDIDVPQTEKDVIRAEVARQLENNSIDIQTLAKKHPIYAQNIARAQGKGVGGILSGLFGRKEDFQEWVANEYFAHRGATVKYNTDYLYKMRSTSAVDEIVRKHIRWGKDSRVNLKPEYIDPNVATGIMVGGVEPGVSFEAIRKAMGTVWPGGTTVRFSGKDDAWNTIPGLQETGLASPLRKINTEFGSGWDKARALAKTILGKSELTEEGFTEFLGSNVFKKALRTAKKVGVLGKGGQGTATLMQAKFPGGQSLEFVKKQIKGFEDVSTEETLAGIVQERTAMRLMQDKGVPTLYGRKGQRTMYMEYIQGETSESILARGGQLTQNQINELQSILDTAHSRGVAHGDIWHSKEMREMWASNRERLFTSRPEDFELLPVNTLITPEGRTAVIDWGLSSSAMVAGEVRTGENALASMMKPNVTPAQIDNLIIDALKRQEGRAPGYAASMRQTTSRKFSAAKTFPKAILPPKTAAEGARARRKLINSARDLKVAQAHISNAAVIGAKGHRRYNTGRGLEQINEVLGFAHTIPEDIGIAMTWPARR